MNLKLSKKAKPLVIDTRKKSGREVILEGIGHQIELLKDPDYTVERYRNVVGKDHNGNPIKTRELTKRPPRKWFFEVEGVWHVEIRYGSSYRLEIEQGFPSIECGGSTDDVINTLEAVAKMVSSGQLDNQIATLKAKARRT